MTRLVSLALVVACSLPSCGGGDGLLPNQTYPDAGSMVSGREDGSAIGLPACAYPHPGDPCLGTCGSNRILLACLFNSGGTEVCLSNNLTSCPAPQIVFGSIILSCSDECAADEYAVSCNGSDPPTALGCSDRGAVPFGGVFYCCPCPSGS